jgi:ribonuclease P/MRP protein subunit RPP40
MIDFRKAFDTVNHSVLINKLKRLSLPHFAINWIIHFLSDRSQRVKFGDNLSSSCFITRSIIQGSGLGPTLYIIMESDLQPMSFFINLMFKFADDHRYVSQGTNFKR